ncbi:MAG: polyprenyl synthetase family protein [Candidatus Hydrogenedentales bacterium]
MDMNAFLNNCAALVDTALETYIAACIGAPAALLDVMRYSVQAGGKRFRPALALGACELACGDPMPALPGACALEMIHTYSLIHDDLPAMDNDDMRRGKPTSHKIFGEAVAILAGDGLLTLAFQVIGQRGNLAAIHELARASGIEGMVGGQYLDTQAEGKAITLDALKEIHSKKTGALITASLRIGALLGDGSDHLLDCLTGYGEHLGLLFQITDDILDVTGDSAALGKTIGKDQEQGKATYPALLGLDQARALADETAAAALATLHSFGSEADIFRRLIDFLRHRNH